MRTDDSTERDTFRKSSEWTHNPTTGESTAETDRRMVAGDEIVDGKLVVHSLSGKERNHVFLNRQGGKSFANLSALSGLDSVADSRGFALLDYDHDGWQDVVLVNANAPLTQLYHNDIAGVPGVRAGMIALRFVGGNVTASPSKFAPRDGYGALAEVSLSGGVKLTREHRCGEGFATQNSTTLVFGLGDRPEAAALTVRWPSGKEYTLANIPEGTLVTAYENRPDGAFAQKPYRDARPHVATSLERRKFPLAREAVGKVQVYTTTATWCAACVNHLPGLERLKEDGVALFGVPVDPEDDEEKLGAYVAERQPAYEMLASLGPEDREKASAFLARALHTAEPVLPTSVITDGDGNVLEVMTGVPTLSQVRKWRAAP